MAMLTRVCCCDIKIAMMVLAILTLITSGVNAAFTAFSAVSTFLFYHTFATKWMDGFEFDIYSFTKNKFNTFQTREEGALSRNF